MQKGIDTTILNAIKETFLANDKPRWTERGITEKDLEVMRLCKDKLRVAHDFILDVEKAEGIYQEILKKEQIHDSQKGELHLPFDSCLIAFEKPLLIRWNDKFEKIEYVKKPLCGYLIFPLFNETSKAEAEMETKEKVIIESRYYRAVLFFKEDPNRIPDIPKDVDMVLGQQYITFNFLSINGEITHEAVIKHFNHVPCGNKILCNINAEGDNQYPNIKKGWVCDEIVVRDAFIELLQTLNNKIFEVQAEYVHRKRPVRFQYSTDTYSLPTLPLGFPYTKGNLPKDNYVQYLDGKRKVYDKEEIAFGTGIKHRYRYDVRRFPRIVNNKIIWISPHQRGSGKYIPKIYSNRKTWFVNYFWYHAEKLTKYRIIEILIINILQFFRKT